jgi:hypothetical protein
MILEFFILLVLVACLAFYVFILGLIWNDPVLRTYTLLFIAGHIYAIIAFLK